MFDSLLFYAIKSRFFPLRFCENVARGSVSDQYFTKATFSLSRDDRLNVSIIRICFDLYVLIKNERERKREEYARFSLTDNCFSFHLFKNTMNESSNAGLWSFIYMYRDDYVHQIEKLIAAFHFVMVIHKKFKVNVQAQVKKKNNKMIMY